MCFPCNLNVWMASVWVGSQMVHTYIHIYCITHNVCHCKNLNNYTLNPDRSCKQGWLTQRIMKGGGDMIDSHSMLAPFSDKGPSTLSSSCTIFWHIPHILRHSLYSHETHWWVFPYHWMRARRRRTKAVRVRHTSLRGSQKFAFWDQIGLL